MNMNRRMKNRIAQTTAVALTAVMMSGQVMGAQAASTNTAVTTENAVIATTGTTAGFAAALAQLQPENVTADVTAETGTTAGFTAALAEIQPDTVNLTLNLQGEALLSGVEDGVTRATEEQQAAEEAAAAEAAAQAAAEEAARLAEEEEERAQAAEPTALVVTQNESVAATADDVTLLAALIQCEAGNECYEGQVAVGSVVVNRLNRGYAGSIYGVIYQPYQFGPASSGKVAATIASGPSATALAAAQEALSGVDYTGGATGFRNVRSGMSGTVIGNHVFF